MSGELRQWLAAEGHAALRRVPSDERAHWQLQDALGNLLRELGHQWEDAEGLLGLGAATVDVFCVLHKSWECKNVDT